MLCPNSKRYFSCKYLIALTIVFAFLLGILYVIVILVFLSHKVSKWLEVPLLPSTISISQWPNSSLELIQVGHSTIEMPLSFLSLDFKRHLCLFILVNQLLSISKTFGLST